MADSKSPEKAQRPDSPSAGKPAVATAPAAGRGPNLGSQGPQARDLDTPRRDGRDDDADESAVDVADLVDAEQAHQYVAPELVTRDGQRANYAENAAKGYDAAPVPAPGDPRAARRAADRRARALGGDHAETVDDLIADIRAQPARYDNRWRGGTVEDKIERVLAEVRDDHMPVYSSEPDNVGEHVDVDPETGEPVRPDRPIGEFQMVVPAGAASGAEPARPANPAGRTAPAEPPEAAVGSAQPQANLPSPTPSGRQVTNVAPEQPSAGPGSESPAHATAPGSSV